MSEHRAIDHKDSDAEYAAQVRDWVAKRAECNLLDSFDSTFLIGDWESSISRSDDGKPDFTFLADGTYRTPNAFDGPTPNTWKIDGDHFVETYWSPPAPEYDIQDPMQGQECYRCAQLEDGRFAFWNGDSSLLVFLTRIDGQQCRAHGARLARFHKWKVVSPCPVTADVMPDINEANPEYLAPFVCVDCRRSFKRPWQKGVAERPCPLCGQPALHVSQKFKPPRSSNNEQWEKVRLLIEHGFRFFSVRDSDGENIPYPATLREAREWIKRRTSSGDPIPMPKR